MRYTGSEAVKEVEKRFILGKHRMGLEQVMNEYNMVVAFRAAGVYTLEKLDHGAAAKPHTILDKSIKPAEMGLADDFPTLSLADADKSLVLREPLRTARRFLCGLVGYRNDLGQVTGVYLSQVGQASEQFEKKVPNKNGAVYALFDTTEALVQCISEILAEEDKPLSCAGNFVTGDYDLHEIQLLKEERLSHIKADSVEEALYLQLLSLGSMGWYVSGQTYVPRFSPDEKSPIQHGAQDNYLEHMILSERNEKLIPKVLIPDTDLAVYRGDIEGNGEWTVFDNRVDSNREYHELIAIMAQVRGMKEYYRNIHGELPTHWQFDDWRVQDAVMGYYGLTPEECELKF